MDSRREAWDGGQKSFLQGVCDQGANGRPAIQPPSGPEWSNKLGWVWGSWATREGLVLAAVGLGVCPAQGPGLAASLPGA